MDESVPATTRANARIAFVRALGAHTDAIKELRSWRLSELSAISEAETSLFEINGGHPFFDDLPLIPSSAFLRDLAGDERVEAATSWSVRWNVSVGWLQSWAVFSLLVWDAARRCNNADCPHDCRLIRESDDDALEAVTAPQQMWTFGEPPSFVSMLKRMGSADGDFMELLPPHKRAVAPPLPGPHPLLETKKRFLSRASNAWDMSVRALETQGVDLAVPRKQELHCEWLVRYSVLGQTASAIVSDSDKTDISTVYKAVKALAEVIDLPIRRRED